MTTVISAAGFADRLRRTTAALVSAGVDAMLVGVGPELEWLVGYAAQGHERLNLLIVDAGGAITFVGPRLEESAARAAPGLSDGSVRVLSWHEGEDPYSFVQRSLAVSQGPRRQVAVSDGLRAAFVLRLQAVLSNTDFQLASTSLGPLRQVKDEAEVVLLREAALAADRVIVALSNGPLVGRTEAAIASEVRDRLVREGHDTAEFAIVASGPNSASPHHEPAGRVVQAGEPLLFDIGGRRAGYFSDITRTIWVAGDPGVQPAADFAETHSIVQRAQAAGRAAVRPGVSFESIDAAARDVIAAAGCGERFIHRLGHGIGLEVHEEPYCVTGNTALTMAGNTFSIEPGVYYDGRYGVRIEDVVLCTADGVESFNQAPRDMLVVRGT